MTQILNVMTSAKVFHASDRLISHVDEAGTVTPYDTSANKTLVLKAEDAFVVVGYSGVAYLQSDYRDQQIPTDFWLAEILAEDDLSGPLPGQHCGTKFGGSKGLESVGIESLVARIVERLDAKSVGEPLSVEIAGWWLNPEDQDDERLIEAEISNTATALRDFRTDFEIPEPGAAADEVVRVVGTPTLAPQCRARLLADLPDIVQAGDQVRERLISEVRSIATERDGVGRGVLTMEMQLFRPHAAVWYEPDPTLPADVGLVAGLSPWFVTKSALSGPNLNVGPAVISYHHGGAEFVVNGPALPDGSDLRLYVGPQGRQASPDPSS